MVEKAGETEVIKMTHPIFAQWQQRVDLRILRSWNGCTFRDSALRPYKLRQWMQNRAAELSPEL
jgi:hypothetical protein